MTFLSVLYSVIILPLELFFEMIFSIAYKAFGNAGLSIVFMSLAVNFLVLPLYKRADELQAEERDIQAKMALRLKHIKKAFKGDERFFMIQEYYRINNYKPVYALKSSVSLFLQIPFFIAAYHFLSNLTLLTGQSLGPVKDFSQPDGIIVIGTLSINLLPILMTVINLISAEIYTKGQPFKSKIVLYLSALVFLVLLYNSPSGLVFYWTFNNVFSLVKNAVTKLIKLPKIKTKKFKYPEYDPSGKKVKFLFFVSAAFMTILTGLLIPSSVIASSPDEFVFLSSMQTPNHYVLVSLCVAAGLFLGWIVVFFFLSSDKWKYRFAKIMLLICSIAAVSYFIFPSRTGTVSTELEFDDTFYQDIEFAFIMTLLVVLVGIVVLLLDKLFKGFARYIVLTGTVAMLVMGIINTSGISGAYAETLERMDNSAAPSITLSRNGKNVVVIMLDWALSGTVPYIFQEDPALVKKYDGFTYYPNTISYGAHTNLGAPALYGGYEYTPDMLNKRADETLVDKHNEAILVLPVLFSNNGFDTTVIDPPLVNYREISEVSIFKPYKNIKACLAQDVMAPDQEDAVSQLESSRTRNFFCYSLLQVSPAVLHKLIYDDGNYNQLSKGNNIYVQGTFHYPQACKTTSTAKGMNRGFINSYMVLEGMPNITNIVDDNANCFLFMDNNTTHEPTLMQAPGYIPSDVVDNSEYEARISPRSLPDGSTIHLDSTLQMKHYHVNFAAYESLAKWFDYLRENGVWDNTRIILVSDHGRELFQFNNMVYRDLNLDVESVNPILFVKDFNSRGFKTSYDFMTNADVPTLATNNLISNPINPFTGNPINSLPKTEKPQLVTIPEKWRPQENMGNKFNPGPWYSVHDNIFERKNWEYLGDY